MRRIEREFRSPSKCSDEVLCVLNHFEYLYGSVRGARSQSLAVVVHLGIVLQNIS